MTRSRTHRFASAALAALFLVSAAGASAAPADKKFAWTTQSEQAKTYAMQIMRAIETFSANAQTIELAKKVVEADPNFAFGHYLVATFSPSPEEAKPHMDKALELAKSASDGERRYIEGMVLVRSQRADQALPIFLELSNQYPDERLVQMMLGQITTNLGNAKAARYAFQRAIKLDGSTPRAYTFLGNLALLDGDFKTATTLYNKSLKMKAANSVPFGPYSGLAYTHIYNGDYDAAIKVFEQLRTDYVKSGNAANFPEVFIYNSIARVHLESGRAEQAIREYEAGFATVEKSSLDDQQKAIWRGRLLHGKGRALAKLGRHDDAWKEAEQIKTMIEQGGEAGKQFWPAYHYIAGYLKYEAGDYAAAIEHMKQADQNDPFHLLILARSYEKAGDEASAQKTYRLIVDSKVSNIERALAYPEAKKKLKA